MKKEALVLKAMFSTILLSINYVLLRQGFIYLGWPQTLYIAEVGFELLFSRLHLSGDCSGCRPVLLAQFMWCWNGTHGLTQSKQTLY